MRACDRQLIQFLHLKPCAIGAGALEIVAILFHVCGLDFVCIVVERTGGGMVKCDNDLHFRCQYGVVHSSDSFWSDSENPCHNFSLIRVGRNFLKITPTLLNAFRLPRWY